MITSRSSLRLAKMGAVFSALMMCAACAASPEVRPALPAPPVNFGTSVPRPRIRVGDDARELAARSLRSLDEANSRLSNDRAFYNDVQSHFGEAQK